MSPWNWPFWTTPQSPRHYWIPTNWWILPWPDFSPPPIHQLSNYSAHWQSWYFPSGLDNHTIFSPGSCQCIGPHVSLWGLPLHCCWWWLCCRSCPLCSTCTGMSCISGPTPRWMCWRLGLSWTVSRIGVTSKGPLIFWRLSTSRTLLSWHFWPHLILGIRLIWVLLAWYQPYSAQPPGKSPHGSLSTFLSNRGFRIVYSNHCP